MLLRHPRTRRSGSCDSNSKKNRLSNRNQSGPIVLLQLNPTSTQILIEGDSNSNSKKNRLPNRNQSGNRRNAPIQVEDGAAVEVEAEAEGEEEKGMV